MEYLKHVHSGRVYRVMEDHGPDHPYLYSQVDSGVRTPPKVKEQFFRTCEAPEFLPERYDITVPQEIAWEDRRIRATAPIIVVAPVSEKPKPGEKVYSDEPIPKKLQTQSLEFTIQDLAMELGCTAGQARKILRGSKLEKPQGGWKWTSSQEAEPYRRFLKKNLK